MALDNARTPQRANEELITIAGEEGIGTVNFIFFRDDGGNVGDNRAIHPRFRASAFGIPDKTNLVDAEINFRDDFGAVLLLGVVEVAKHQCREAISGRRPGGRFDSMFFLLFLLYFSCLCIYSAVCEISNQDSYCQKVNKNFNCFNASVAVMGFKHIFML